MHNALAMTKERMNIYEQISRNRFRTWGLVTIFICLFIFIGIGLDHQYGIGLRFPFFTTFAFLFALFSSIGSYIYGDKLILSSTHARGLNLTDLKQRQWQNVVEEMSIAAGIPAPKTYLINDPDPNAFATGRDPQHASIAVTKGLLDMLNRQELQAVCAHEMSHIKNFDIRIMLFIAVLIGSIALVSDWATRLTFRSSRRRDSKGNGGVVILLIWLIVIILAPIISQIIAMCVSRRREYLADASGAELTRNPLAMASALEKIDSKVEPTRSVNRGTAHLCICDPKGHLMGNKQGYIADLFATHPPIKSRIDALKQMAYTNA